MDRKERSGSHQAALLDALDGRQAAIFTSGPGIIQSFDPGAMTCSVQLATQMQVFQKDGTWSWVTLPVMVDVPVCFPGGGGYTLSFPVAAGDEALIVIAHRCIDAWWQNGGVQPQAEFRMHDLSDGFALPGIRSQPRVIPNVSTNSVQLRSDDGLSYVELAGGHACKVRAPGGIDLNGVTIDASGHLIASQVTAAGVNLKGHDHAGVTRGGARTDPT